MHYRKTIHQRLQINSTCHLLNVILNYQYSWNWIIQRIKFNKNKHLPSSYIKLWIIILSSVYVWRTISSAKSTKTSAKVTIMDKSSSQSYSFFLWTACRKDETPLLQCEIVSRVSKKNKVDITLLEAKKKKKKRKKKEKVYYRY